MSGVTIELDYRPQARQCAFHESDADEVLYGGAAGGGKSTAIVNDAMQHCLEVPGARAVLFRRTFPELNAPGGLIEEVAKWVPYELATRAGLRWTFKNGSTLTLAHCQHETDVEKWHGAQFTYLGVDEAGEWTTYMLRYLMSRVRTTIPGVRPRVRLTANPLGIGFAHLKQRYVKPVLLKRVAADETWQPEADPGKPQPPTRAFIPAKHTDNAYLDTGYVARLYELPEAERAALLDGSWELPAFDGQVFGPAYIEWAQEHATGFAPALEDGRRYLKLWDLANRSDWMVNIVLDPNVMPAQIVRFDRYRRRGWRENAADMQRVHDAYPGETVYDATGVGDALGAFLEIPATPLEWHHGNKSRALRRLSVLLERGGIAGPATGTSAAVYTDENGIEHVWDELLQYRWDDKKLVQDCVMTLALAGERLEMPSRRVAVAMARLAAPAPDPLASVPTPDAVDPLLAHASTLRALHAHAA